MPPIWLAALTVPVRLIWFGAAKRAETNTSSLTCTRVTGSAPEAASPQPVNSKPARGEAVTVTVEPAGTKPSAGRGGSTERVPPPDGEATRLTRCSAVNSAVRVAGEVVAV